MVAHKPYKPIIENSFFLNPSSVPSGFTVQTNSPIKFCSITTVSFTTKAFLLDQLAHLSCKGMDITIVCDPDSEFPDDPDFSKEIPPVLRYHPIHLKRNADCFSTLRSIANLAFFFRKNCFDIIQYSTPKAAFASSVAGCLAGVPVRLYCQWGIRYVGFSGLKRFFFKTLERITCLLSTHVSPDSNGNRDFSIQEGLYSKPKSSVVLNGSANGVSLERFDIRQKSTWRKETRRELGIDNCLVFGWVGRISRDKGINELVEAFRKTLERKANARLLLVGPMEEHHGLTPETLEAITTHPSILLAGQRKDIERLYAGMDVLVSPSYREGFGITAIEAQAMEVPVILSDIPGPREALIEGKTGFLVPPRSVREIELAMTFMAENEEKRRDMGKSGRRFVEKNFEQVKFWNAVYEHRIKLLEDHRQPARGTTNGC